jgi:outer membrane receptor protein involved in Fe transport
MLMLTGNAQLQPERVRAVEAGARMRLWKKSVLELAAFHNSYKSLHCYQVPFPLNEESLRRFLSGAGRNPGTPSTIPATLVNCQEGAFRGGEASIYYDVHRNWRLTGSYSGVFGDLRNMRALESPTMPRLNRAYPKHMLQLRSSWDLARRWTLDVEVYRTAMLADGGLPPSPAFTRADVRIERKLGESSGIYVNGQNLLRPRQQEFAGNVVFPAGTIGRSIAVGFRWER